VRTTNQDAADWLIGLVVVLVIVGTIAYLWIAHRSKRRH